MKEKELNQRKWKFCILRASGMSLIEAYRESGYRGGHSYASRLELEVIFYVGNALFDLGKYQEAIDAYDKAIKINPKNVYAWHNKGNALGNLGKHHEAIDAYDKVIEIDPKNADAWNNKGNALVNLGKRQEAVDAYDKATIEEDTKLGKCFFCRKDICNELELFVSDGDKKYHIDCYEKEEANEIIGTKETFFTGMEEIEGEEKKQTEQMRGKVYKRILVDISSEKEAGGFKTIEAYVKFPRKTRRSR